MKNQIVYSICLSTWFLSLLVFLNYSHYCKMYGVILQKRKLKKQQYLFNENYSFIKKHKVIGLSLLNHIFKWNVKIIVWFISQKHYNVYSAFDTFSTIFNSIYFDCSKFVLFITLNLIMHIFSVHCVCCWVLKIWLNIFHENVIIDLCCAMYNL